MRSNTISSKILIISVYRAKKEGFTAHNAIATQSYVATTDVPVLKIILSVSIFKKYLLFTIP